MTLYIFGAGATRGCEFVEPKTFPCLPPLDNDFFTQLQRVRNPKHQELINDVMKDVVEMFGVNFQVTLESVFTTLEHTIKVLKITSSTRKRYKLSDLQSMRKRLMQSIAVVLEESLSEPSRSGGGSTWKPRPCSYHENFVKRVLKPKDSIISFNYDCVLDHALCKQGNKKWNARYGYNFYLGSQGNKLKGDEDWQPKDPATKDDTVSFYKLHGSLHFKIEDPESENSKIELKKLPYAKTHGFIKFSIIPPEWHKKYEGGVFGRLWANASSAIYKSREIVVVGYSMPLSDLHTTALFRTSVAPNLKSLTVINPDREARKRTRTIFQRGINKNTRVMSFDHLHEYVAFAGGQIKNKKGKKALVPKE